MIIANYLATDLVGPVYESPGSYGSLEALVAQYGFAVQIYCDFSAYSDIAIGVAGLLGFSFPRNFNQPYRSASLQEFWRRWHISLSTWLKDYLYRPLGGSQDGEGRTRRNLVIVMLCAGLWHGAAWTFVVFGLLHGIGMVFERMIRDRFQHLAKLRPVKLLNVVVTFHFVCLSMIFFAAGSFEVATEYLSAIFSGVWSVGAITPFSLLLILIGMAINFIPADTMDRAEAAFTGRPALVQAIILAMALLALGAMGPNGIAPFIYYRF